MRDEHEWLFDMLEAIERIEQRSDVARADFDRDELLQVWMVHNVQIIGEVASQLSDEFRARYPQVHWRAVASMRNVIVHAYFRVDLDEVWSVVQNDIPSLKTQVEGILNSLAE